MFDREAIAIAGAGKLGQALARLLVQADEPLAAIASRTPESAARGAAFAGGDVRAATIENLPKLAGRILIITADGAIAETAGRLAAAGMEGGAALHCCGAMGPEALAPLAARGVSCGALHPLQTIPSPEEGVAALRGIFWGLTAVGPAAAWARRLVELFDGRILSIPVEMRGRYHAAGVMACNALVAIEDAAAEIMEAAGVPAGDALSALEPMVRRTVENIFQFGAAQALTGPVLRGDAGTVARHLESIAALAPSLFRLYRAAGLHALEIARRRGLDETAAAQLERLLSDNGSRNG